MIKERKEALDLAVSWLLKSIDPATGGSRANYSVLFNGFKGWSGPYPETTGYIIPTFLNIAAKFKELNMLPDKALKMGEWLLTLQFDDGAFPADIYYANKVRQKSIFNTGQIILGLTSLYDFTKDTRYLDSTSRAANWLVKNQSDDGTWPEYNYVNGFSPSYYSRVAWPLLKVYARDNDQVFKEAAVKNLRSIQKRQLSNGFIEGSGFQPDSYVFLHTLAYTIRGFLESALLLDDQDLWDSGYRFAEKIFRKFELKKQLYGAYYSDFTGVMWYQCLTGNVQIAIIWLKIYQRTGDARFLSAASKAIDVVVRYQVKNSFDGNRIGAVAGSAPVFGRYMFFRYPNWAVKFLADALLLEDQALQTLS